MDEFLKRLDPSKAYEVKFGDSPKFHYFLAPLEAREEFDRLMLMAIERGTPLTEAEVDGAPAPVYHDGMEDGSWSEYLDTVRPGGGA